MKLFRFFLKLISLPFIIVLSIINPFLTFLLCFSEKITAIVSTFLAGMGILMWVTGSNSLFHSAAIVIMAFLISPFGIPRVIEWMVERLYDLNDSLKGFVRG
jgi:hypothetical protein